MPACLLAYLPTYLPIYLSIYLSIPTYLYLPIYTYRLYLLSIPTFLCYLSIPIYLYLPTYASYLYLPSIPTVYTYLSVLLVYTYLSILTVYASYLCYCLCLLIYNLGEKSAQSKALPDLNCSLQLFASCIFKQWSSGVPP